MPRPPKSPGSKKSNKPTPAKPPEKVPRLPFTILGSVPVVMGAIGCGVLTKSEKMFADLGVTLPPFTKLLLNHGGILPMGLLALGGIAMIVATWLQRPRLVSACFMFVVLTGLTLPPLIWYRVNSMVQQISGKPASIRP